MACRPEVLAFEADHTRGRFDQSEDKTTERALSGSRLADQTERLTGTNLQRYFIHSANLSFGASTQDGLAEGKDFCQVANFNQGRCHAWTAVGLFAIN